MNPLLNLRLRNLFLNLLPHLLLHLLLDLFLDAFLEPLLFLGLSLAIESARAEGYVPTIQSCERYFRDTRGLCAG